MGTVRFLLLWGGLTLCLCLMASAHSQPGHREGDRLDSAKKHNSKNGPPGKRRNENKERVYRPGGYSFIGGDHTKLSKPRPEHQSPVKVKDTPNIMDLSRSSLENGRRRRQSYEKPKKRCPGCYSPMGKPQRQKRDVEEREPSRRRGHKKPKDRKEGSPPFSHRGLARSLQQEREDSEGKRRERGRGGHRPGSLSGVAIKEEEPRKHHGHHKKEKHGKHRRNHHHEHSEGKIEREE
ncbi:splicing regulatory glutamine/lysine-rich protein 1 isoform X2 [Xenopus tropicalis]|uniref:Splicing regulatory glutamine/lysine-rich protein 1 isoform X2 n=1 Tax=Xenopus tropicalis TaxID=8364 RepID=A0A8J1JQT5_XENTR|nr:splicing regulatory glutamine/lysine-rich protein 1 isoform X2 [Xenopus tropicalis]|eukprot:XP_017945453.1 PREDICTED: splicing regulatory glutamine/lysine-rich protein 1-like isoform X2 [Xenopus tropicalis]